MLDCIYITECPRDAWQGLNAFVPTQSKINYITKIWEAGFNTIDFTSFVNPATMPQMADAEELTTALTQSIGQNHTTKALAIVANMRGAEQACGHGFVNQIGFPLSISEQFQLRNTNKTIAQALTIVKEIAALANEYDKSLVVYLSMAFGNPYQEEIPEFRMASMVNELVEMGINTISLADTIGVATAGSVEATFNHFIALNPAITWKCHLHTLPQNALSLIEAAYKAGARHFEGAIGGYGGCPMAADTLTGNMPTEQIVAFAKAHGLQHNVNEAVILQAAKEFRILAA